MINDKICYFNNHQDKLEVRKGMIYVNNSLVKILGHGVDGEVYKYKDKALKLYHDDIHIKEYLNKEQINILCTLSTKHIVLPKEPLLSKEENPGFVMEYIDLDKEQEILFSNKHSIITEIKETEKELIEIGKNHFLLDDTQPQNLFYNDTFHIFDADSFIYDKKVCFSTANIENFVYSFIKKIIFILNQNSISSVTDEQSKKETLALTRKMYYLYKKGNYTLLSNFLEDILVDETNKKTRLNYIDKKIKSLNKNSN